MAWLQLHLVTAREHVATLEDALLAAGALSITLGDQQDQPILEPGVGETPLWPEVRISALFDADCDRQHIIEHLHAVHTLPAGEARWETVEDRIWEREWLQHFRPMRFGKRLWVAPADARIESDDAIVLRLDPGLAFGTGTHPSTALCLQWLAANPPAGLEVVDYGCGSGILSLAALLLGADRVHALDIDPQALVATRDNAARNALAGDRLHIDEACASETIKADLVLANILAGVLVELAPRFACILRPNGRAVLAGILTTQAEAVRAAYAAWFDCEAIVADAEWCRLDLRRIERS
jgi:ribosomal protein L11 methyltransferase